MDEIDSAYPVTVVSIAIVTGLGHRLNVPPDLIHHSQGRGCHQPPPATPRGYRPEPHSRWVRTRIPHHWRTPKIRLAWIGQHFCRTGPGAG